MIYKKLGKSDLNISRIGFGAMSLKDESNKNKDLLLEGLKNGINYIDTADLYENGANETLIGNAFSEVARDKYILATKVGNQMRPDGNGWDWNPRKSYILSEIDNSLRRLQTDYIDLYQLHGGTMEDNIDETIEAFEILKEKGKIREYGISSIRPNVIREYVKQSNIQSVMMQYNLLDRRPEEEAFPLLEKEQISVLVRGAVASGLLIDKPAKEYLNYTKEEVAKMQSFIADFPISKVQLAIQFVLSQSAVTSAIIGIHTPKQLQEALEAEATTPLTEKDLFHLQSLLPINQYTAHR